SLSACCSILLSPATRHRRALPSSPTRRSSDLSESGVERASGVASESDDASEDSSSVAPVAAAATAGAGAAVGAAAANSDDDESRSEEHTSELQSRFDLVCRLLLDKKIRSIVRG